MLVNQFKVIVISILRTFGLQFFEKLSLVFDIACDSLNYYYYFFFLTIIDQIKVSLGYHISIVG
jgi:hypothetical protein